MSEPVVRKGYRHVGLVIGLLGIGFVVRELIRGWDEVVEAFGHVQPWGIVGAFGLGFLGMAVMGLGWRLVLAELGSVRPVVDTLYRFSMGEMGKYVPGGVWSVVGRGEMARRAGVPGSVAYQATLLSIGLTYLAACLTAAIAAVLGVADLESRWLWMLGLLPVGLIALHPRAQAMAYRIFARVTRGRAEFRVLGWSTAVRLVLWHVPAWLSVGGATWLVASSLQEASVDFWSILLACCIAWTVGLLAIPVPGGLGVREAVFVSLAATLATSGVAAAVAIAARLLFLMVDLAMMATFSTMNRRNRNNAVAPPENA